MRRVTLTSNAAGEVRVTTCRTMKRGEPAKQAAEALLVYCPVLQDSISTGHFATKAGYGWQPTGRQFTPTARRRLREFGGLVDSTALATSVFLTGTLPGSSPSAMGALAAWSAWVVSRLSQWLRDTFPSVMFFGVWEYQRRGALHLHLCVQVSTSEDAKWLTQNWKRRWAALIDGVSTRSGVDLWQRTDGTTWQQKRWKLRTDAQVVEKSVSRYLSKYLGKSALACLRSSALPPSSWWFASRNLQEAAAASRVKVDLPTLDNTLALNLYQSIAGEICATSSVTYPVVNPYDASQYTVIGLMPSAVAGVLMRALRDNIKVLSRGEALHTPDRLLSVPEVATMFAALRGP